MRYALIFEDDVRISGLLSSILVEADPSLNVESFRDIKDLQKWLALKKDEIIAHFEEKGEAKTVTAPPPIFVRAERGPSIELLDEVPIIIFNSAGLGPKVFPILKMLRDYTVKNRMSLPETPTVFCITAFDDEKSKAWLFTDPIVSNVFYKPIDRSWATQELYLILAGQKPFSAK